MLQWLHSQQEAYQKQPVPVRIAGGHGPNAVQKPAEGADEQLGIGQGPDRHMDQAIDIVGHENGFDAGEMIDHENAGPIGDIFAAMQVDPGPDQVGKGLDGQSGGAIGKTVHFSNHWALTVLSINRNATDFRKGKTLRIPLHPGYHIGCGPDIQ